MSLDPQTWRELLDAVYEINSAANHADFADAVIAGMNRLVLAQVTVFQVLDRSAQRLITRMSPLEPFLSEEIAYYTAHSNEMPLVAHYARSGATKALRMSDVIKESEWLASNYYRICLQRLDLPYCLALPIAVDESTVAGLSFNRRGEDFTGRDCELLDAFAPHFRQAWERHDNPWLDAAQVELSIQRKFRQLGLTPRESEVLYWMTEGKQNREIATILGLQLGTVQDYVARILLRLGQENRHAATVFALQQLRAK